MDYFAIHGPVPATLKAQVVEVLSDGEISLCRGEPPQQLDPQSRSWITPVYSLEPGGPPAVPTGRIFIRFTDHIEVRNRQESLVSAGYTILRINPYARHTAWLGIASGITAEALLGIPRLERLSDVVNVEPEMVKPIARKR